jgi:hypothetical protein
MHKSGPSPLRYTDSPFCWYGDVGNAMPVRRGPAPNRVVDDGIVVEEAERGNDSPVGK